MNSKKKLTFYHLHVINVVTKGLQLKDKAFVFKQCFAACALSLEIVSSRAHYVVIVHPHCT